MHRTLQFGAGSCEIRFKGKQGPTFVTVSNKTVLALLCHDAGLIIISWLENHIYYPLNVHFSTDE
jgi:hypothetical protein